ncbi:MAG: hypothetical protein K6G10_03695 [Butyrivibrio sp.]|nr:hypothetical protein [Butyrivibrio sp.]
MRNITYKKTAIQAIILIFALIALLTVFPFRIWTQVLKTNAGGSIVSESEGINFEYSNRQKFVTRYDRLSSIDVFVTKMERGRYIGATIYDENGALLLETYVDTEGLDLPCYVNIPLELNVEEGKDHYLVLEACRSKYYVAYENIPEDSGYVGSLTRNGVDIPGLHLAANYNYRLPLSKALSLKIIAAIIAVAAALCVVTALYYKKNPEKNDLVTVAGIVRSTADPIAVLVFASLMIMVFPLKIFDRRPLDIIFYELGLAIAAFIVFYAINHKSVKHEIGISFWQSLKNENRLQYILIMFSMAMAIWYGCAYMNDLYDIFHSLSERRMLIWLLVMMVLTFSLKEALNLVNLIWIAVSVPLGVHWYNLHRMAEEEKEYDLHNAITKYEVIIVILAGLILLNFIRTAVILIKARLSKGHAHEEKQSIRISGFGLVLLVFFIAIIILRNTRWWGVALACTFTAFYIRFAIWDRKKDYYKILSGGLMMNFAISLGFSLLHRYFAGYVSGRFAFIFHTVTVTAEYLTFMGSAATVLLVTKIVALPPKTSLKETFKSAWKEMTLFGFIMAYAIFTVSRTAYLAIIVAMLGVIIVVMAYNKKQFVRLFTVLLLSVIVCFPPAFTLQRMIPAIVADPVIYPIDDTDEFIRGGASWGSTNFMCVERFGSLFVEKIFGKDMGDYEYPIDIYNYDMDGNGDPIYDYYGFPFEGSDEQEQKYGLALPKEAEYLLAANGFTRAEYMMLLEQMEDYVDLNNKWDVISNGRITIFGSYLKVLNLWGHEEMGAELPNGEIAVHAHNTYMQVAYDHGSFVGVWFILMLMIAAASGVSLYKKYRKEEPLSLMTFAIVLGFMVAGISEWVFQFSNPMTIALMLSLAPLVIKTKEN